MRNWSSAHAVYMYDVVWANVVNRFRNQNDALPVTLYAASPSRQANKWPRSPSGGSVHRISVVLRPDQCIRPPGVVKSPANSGESDGPFVLLICRRDRDALRYVAIGRRSCHITARISVSRCYLVLVFVRTTGTVDPPRLRKFHQHSR